jgi:CO/xanthine dehydrogenase FAD-binding subunit
VPLRRRRWHSRGDPASACGSRAINPFTYVRATDAQKAVNLWSENSNGADAKFLAGGTNLIDLMREGVEQPPAPVDITRAPLNQIEQIDGGLRIGALVRNSHLAADPQVRSTYRLLSEAILNGASAQLSQYGDHGRQSDAADAVLLFLRHGVALQ